MRRLSKFILAMSLGFRLLTGFEAQALAKEKAEPEVVVLINQIGSASKNLGPKTQLFVGDEFINQGEYLILKRDYTNLLSLLDKLSKSKKATQEVREMAKEQYASMKELFMEIQREYAEDQKIIKNAPKLNQVEWWGKPGIYQNNVNGKKAFTFVVFSQSKLRGLARKAAGFKLDRMIKKFIGKSGWAKKPMWGTKYHTDENGVWAMITITIEE